MFTIKCVGDFVTHDEVYELNYKTAKKAYQAMASICRWFIWNDAFMSYGSVYDIDGNELCRY